MKAAYIHNCLKNGEVDIFSMLSNQWTQFYSDTNCWTFDWRRRRAGRRWWWRLWRSRSGARICRRICSCCTTSCTYTCTCKASTTGCWGFPAGCASTYCFYSRVAQSCGETSFVFSLRGAAALSVEQIGRVQKLCKYAISALDYQVGKWSIYPSDQYFSGHSNSHRKPDKGTSNVSDRRRACLIIKPFQILDFLLALAKSYNIFARLSIGSIEYFVIPTKIGCYEWLLIVW